MRITENGNYELVTNGVQKCDLSVNVFLDTCRLVSQANPAHENLMFIDYIKYYNEDTEVQLKKHDLVIHHVGNVYVIEFLEEDSKRTLSGKYIHIPSSTGIYILALQDINGRIAISGYSDTLWIKDDVISIPALE